MITASVPPILAVNLQLSATVNPDSIPVKLAPEIAGSVPVNLAASKAVKLPPVVILFANALVITHILSYFGKTLIVISAEAAGAVTKVKVVPEIV